MRTNFVVDHVALSDYNESLGLYQFIVTFTDGIKARAFFCKNPEWKMTGINRLHNIPCTVCRKDYYCKCLDNRMSEIEHQILELDHGLTAAIPS